MLDQPERFISWYTDESPALTLSIRFRRWVKICGIEIISGNNEEIVPDSYENCSNIS